MRRIDRDRRQQRLDRLQIKRFDISAIRRVQLLQANDPYRFFGQRGNQLVPPTIVLRFHELVNFSGQQGEHFLRSPPIRSGVDRLAVLDLLQDPGDTNFHEFIEVARSDRQEFQPFQQRVVVVAGLFQHALIELQPRKVPVEEIFGACHLLVRHFRLETYLNRVTAMLPESSHPSLYWPPHQPNRAFHAKILELATSICSFLHLDSVFLPEASRSNDLAACKIAAMAVCPNPRLNG